MDLPEGFRVQQIRRRLRPGAVTKLYRKMDDGKLHEKRFVVLAVDEHTVTCVINSEISPFIRHRDDLLVCQVSMSAGRHPFMDHESHVDCSRTRSYLTEDVVSDLCSRPEWMLGDIDIALRASIVAALKRSRTLAIAQVESLCSALETGHS